MIFRLFSLSIFKPNNPHSHTKMAFVKNTKKMTFEQLKACNTVASSFVAPKQQIERSKPCRYYRKPCTNKQCTYAHSLAELTPSVCHFDKKGCKNDKCERFHPMSGQTKEDYCRMNGFFLEELTTEVAAVAASANVPFFDPFEIMDEIDEVNAAIEQEEAEDWANVERQMLDEAAFLDAIAQAEGIDLANGQIIEEVYYYPAPVDA